MDIRRGSTPYLRIAINAEGDLNDLEEIVITMRAKTKQRDWYLSKGEMEFDKNDKICVIHFSQEDTLALAVGTVQIQAKIKLKDQEVYVSDIVSTSISQVLNEAVI